MKLNSLHSRRVLSEQAEQPSQGDPLDALRLDAPEGGAPAPEGQEGAPEAQEEAPETPETHAQPGHKVDQTINAVEKLQSAAAGLEAASFVVRTEWSDFSLSQQISQIKQQLIPIIGKVKEHMMQAGAKDPQDEQKVASWLDM
jgi:hypothetical protein